MAAPITVALPWSYKFEPDGTVKELHPESTSTSPYFWVNSGGYMYMKDKKGSTIHGELPSTDERYQAYKTNSDTDFGKHPQNLFRLFTRQEFPNVRQTGSYTIDKYYSDSPGKADSNGVLHFMRMALDGDTGYYAGVRIDGTSVIKKKIKVPSDGNAWTYYPMAQKPLPGGKLPIGKPFNMRTEVKDGAAGGVDISLWWDVNNTGDWVQLLTAIDNGRTYGGAVIKTGHSGIRSDFMDLTFSDLKLELPGTITPPIKSKTYEDGRKEVATVVYNAIKGFI